GSGTVLAVGTHTLEATLTPSSTALFNYANFFVSLTVNAPPINVTGVNFSATAGAPFSGTVATFTTADTANAAGAFTATIAWGDGSTSNGIVKGSAGSFTVSGSHTFADPKASPGYAVSVQISNPNTTPNPATANDTATVTSLGQGVVRGLTGGIGFWHNKN